jgi:hypothetical protein
MEEFKRLAQPSGTPAYVLAIYAIRFGIAAVALAIALIISASLFGNSKTSVANEIGPWIGGALFGCLLVAALLIFLRNQRKNIEAKAGYVTLPYALQELDQLDPTTGFIIRSAGEPFLTREQLRKARLRAAVQAKQIEQQ